MFQRRKDSYKQLAYKPRAVAGATFLERVIVAPVLVVIMDALGAPSPEKMRPDSWVPGVVCILF